MSYVGKIISDIIKTTSDIFFALCNVLKTKTIRKHTKYTEFVENQRFAKKSASREKNVAFGAFITGSAIN